MGQYGLRMIVSADLSRRVTWPTSRDTDYDERDELPRSFCNLVFSAANDVEKEEGRLIHGRDVSDEEKFPS